MYTYRCVGKGHVFERVAAEGEPKRADRGCRVDCPDCGRKRRAYVIANQQPWTFSYYSPELRAGDICPVGYHDSATLVRFRLTYRDFILDFNTGAATCKICDSSIHALPVGYEQLYYTDIHRWAIAHRHPEPD